MTSILNTVLCAGLAAALWTCVGLAVARRVAPRSLALPLAPAIGWAVHSVAVLPLFFVLGLSKTTVTAVLAASVIGAIAALRPRPPADDHEPEAAAMPVFAFALAALLALVPVAAILPTFTSDGVGLAGPIFDHSKVAMIDEMARLGVPPGNPFFGEAGGPARLSYYYLWHFGAAQLALLTGSSGWEADAGLTWFTAFASLSMMMGFATWIGGRRSAALAVIAIAATVSLRPALSWLLGAENAYALIRWPTGFGGWLMQVSWAPQHVASATCVVLAAFLLARLARQPKPATLIVLALIAAAGFESSTWVGGVTFPIAAAAIGLLMLQTIAPERRRPFAGYAVLSALLALGLAAPFLYDQFLATAMRGAAPIAIAPQRVLGDAFPEALRPILDLPAYWLVFLPVEFPGFYPIGVAAMALFVKNRKRAHDHQPVMLAFCALALVSLGVGWLLVSRLGDNNDLGWRGVLPAVILLIVFASAGLSHWLASSKALCAAAVLGLLALGLPQIIYGNVIAQPQPSARIFAATPALWEAVRKHSGPSDRIANNPLFLSDMTPWPVNISWALLSNRRSCYAGRELTLAFAPVTPQRRMEIDAQFIRIFEGDATPEDLSELPARYGCRLVVVTAQDRAWNRDPFAAHPSYRLAEQKAAAWRIYKVDDSVQR